MAPEGHQWVREWLLDRKWLLGGIAARTKAPEAGRAAKQRREKLENEANQAFNKEIYRAEGEAKKMINEAKGYAVERVNYAKGEAVLFELVLAEYKKAPQITPWGWIFWTMIFYNLKKFTSRSI